jgi:hypothetical protein
VDTGNGECGYLYLIGRQVVLRHESVTIAPQRCAPSGARDDAQRGGEIRQVRRVPRDLATEVGDRPDRPARVLRRFRAAGRRPVREPRPLAAGEVGPARRRQRLPDPRRERVDLRVGAEQRPLGAAFLVERRDRVLRARQRRERLVDRRRAGERERGDERRDYPATASSTRSGMSKFA